MWCDQWVWTRGCRFLGPRMSTCLAGCVSHQGCRLRLCALDLPRWVCLFLRFMSGPNHDKQQHQQHKRIDNIKTPPPAPPPPPSPPPPP
eukprot:278793-Chlamydomonas_euryale.AAC.1